MYHKEQHIGYIVLYRFLHCTVLVPRQAAQLA